MTPLRNLRNCLASFWLACCVLAVAGCASWQGPRIDPTGERFLIWPHESPTPTYAVPAGPPAPAVVVPPSGNLQAPPVWPDAPTTFAAPGTPVVVGPPAAPPAVGAAVPVGPAVPVGVVAPAGCQPCLRITPDRVLAPVGSEVVLKTGICGTDGRLVTNERVEWLLARDGAGQIVDLSERGHHDLFRWWWDTPRKVDNWYAVGATSMHPTCLNRGTADPNDDVQVLSGEAWVSITSPAEGTSFVTAYAPSLPDWQVRRATATIYWVDAQWVFPISTTVSPGQPHVLTTTVTRRTDGTPVAGWIVRYVVAGGGGSLGYDAGSVTEVPTDAMGRASVEVSPTDVGGGTTIVNMSLLRPGQQGVSASPPLEIGTGSATITWGGGGFVSPPVSSAPIPSYGPSYGAPPVAPADPAPMNVNPPVASPAIPMASDPYTPPAADPYRPPIASPAAPPAADTATGPAAPADAAPYNVPRDQPPASPAGQPDLEVRITRIGSEEVTVGELARFQVVVTNRGNGPAQKIELRDRFDRGLSHPEAQAGEFEVKYPGMRDLAPGQSSTVPLSFEVVSPGRHCHEVIVTAEGGEQAVDRMCVVALAAEQAATPTLELTKLGPARQIVGELAQFKIVVKNTGTVAATNVEVIDQYDQALVPKFTEAGREFLPDGRIQWKIDRLEAGERREFRVQCECVAPQRNACNRAIVKADGGVNYAHEACLEILSPLGPGGPGGAAATPAQSNLRVSIVETANPIQAGQRSTVYVNVENMGGQPERQIEMWLRFPAELVPDTTQIQPAGSFTVVGQEIRFSPIAELRSQERQTYIVPVSAQRAGTVRILARVTSDSMTQPTTTQSNDIQIVPGQ